MVIRTASRGPMSGESCSRERRICRGRTTADLIAIGCDWLNGRDDNISWTYVWGILLERPADLPTGHSTRTLVAQGCDWLSGHDGSESWPRVWQVLMDMESDLPIEFSAKTLVTRGCIWLKGSESNTAWTLSGQGCCRGSRLAGARQSGRDDGSCRELGATEFGAPVESGDPQGSIGPVVPTDDSGAAEYGGADRPMGTTVRGS